MQDILRAIKVPKYFYEFIYSNYKNVEDSIPEVEITNVKKRKADVTSGTIDAFLKKSKK